MKAIRWVGCVMVVAIGVLLSGSPAQGQARAAAEHDHAKAALSTSLTLDVEGRATTLSVAELQALPQTTVTVHNAHTSADETYRGGGSERSAGEVWSSLRQAGSETDFA